MDFLEWCIGKTAILLFIILHNIPMLLQNVVLLSLCAYFWIEIRGAFKQTSALSSKADRDSLAVAKDGLEPAAKKKLISIQTRAAQAQLEAAEAQLLSSRTLMRPIVVPALEYDKERAQFDLVLRNAGMGIAVQAAWSISPTFEAELNQFIWPREARLVPVQHGSVLQAIVRDGDWFKAMQLIPEGDYLVLVNYLDLSGNLWQTQMLTNIGREDAIGEQGFAMIQAADFQRRRSEANTESRVQPWWIPDRPAPERRRTHVVARAANSDPK